MKTLPESLATHLAQEVTTTAMCWRIDRRDGIVLGFTAHDRTLVINGVPHRPSGGMSATAIASAADLSTGNLDVSGTFEADGIRAEDIAAGRFDDAAVEVFLVNWADPDAGKVVLQAGRIGDANWDGDQFKVELRGVQDRLRKSLGATYSPDCRAALGDGACRVPLVAHQWEVTVAGVSGTRGIDLEGALPADGFLNFGRLRAHTGPNGGLSFGILRHLGERVTLLEVPPVAFQAGDRLTVWEGCDKRFETCRSRFLNAENFRGEPYVPGTDSLMRYPDAS